MESIQNGYIQFLFQSEITETLVFVDIMITLPDCLKDSITENETNFIVRRLTDRSLLKVVGCDSSFLAFWTPKVYPQQFLDISDKNDALVLSAMETRARGLIIKKTTRHHTI
jgi:hypothetical protein